MGEGELRRKMGKCQYRSKCRNGIESTAVRSHMRISDFLSANQSKVEKQALALHK